MPHPTVSSEHPPLLAALVADARAAARFRGEGHRLGGRLVTAGQMVRLALESDAYLAQVFYRLGVSARRHGIPVLPRLARAGAAVVAQVHIGPDVVIGPGLYLAHGQVAMSGRVRLGPGVVVFPWATISGLDGEVELATDVRVGTGSVIEGPAHVGDRGRIGANAAVTGIVPRGARIAGIPARPVGGTAPAQTDKVPVHGGNRS
mgnify:FL=1